MGPDQPTTIHHRREPGALLLGALAGGAVAVLSAAYVVVLAVGLLTLPSPDVQIQPPWFAVLEVLILAIAPAMLALAVAVHAWSPPERKPLALLGVAFFILFAGVTVALHFCILVLSHHPAFSGEPWPSLVFGFRWPSLAYALYILAWDVLFPLGALCLAAAIQGPGALASVRALFVLSAVLAFAGLLGVPLADMQVRNIGILGYAVLFPIGAAVMAGVFHRARQAGPR